MRQSVQTNWSDLSSSNGCSHTEGSKGYTTLVSSRHFHFVLLIKSWLRCREHASRPFLNFYVVFGVSFGFLGLRLASGVSGVFEKESIHHHCWAHSVATLHHYHLHFVLELEGRKDVDVKGSRKGGREQRQRDRDMKQECWNAGELS